MNNIAAFLYKNAYEIPDKVFVIDKAREWTYKEVYTKVLGINECLTQKGVEYGDRVLLYCDNSIEYIAYYYAILLTGAIVVPINKNSTAEVISHIITQTKPKLFIGGSILLGKLNNKIDLSSVEHIKAETAFSEAYSGFENECIDLRLKEENQIAMIIFTSGTTSVCKGVTLTHKNLTANTESILGYLKLNTEDSILVTISFTYSYGNSLLLTHTKAGARLCIENRVSYPVLILEQLQKLKVTGLSTVGSYVNILLKQSTINAQCFKELRYLTFSGESTFREDVYKLKELAPHLQIFSMYGMTEASTRLSYLEPEKILEKIGSIGKGMHGVELRVINEAGNSIKPGEIGEIIARGDNIMLKYWNNEEDTKDAIRNGWLYTGDLATIDEDGYIYIKGRKNDIIKYLGYRISPLEIESVINKYENVLESAVIEVNNGSSKNIKAFIVPKNESFKLEELDIILRQSLPAFKRPHIVESIKELPRTVNGKIKRSELRSAEVLKNN